MERPPSARRPNSARSGLAQSGIALPTSNGFGKRHDRVILLKPHHFDFVNKKLIFCKVC